MNARQFRPARRNSVRGLSLPAVFALILTGQAGAQAIDTNRPGFSYSPNVVADGQWQLETGFAYDRPGGSAYSMSAPLAELRFGVADGVEIFVSSMTWNYARSGNGRSGRGLGDVTVGTKLEFGPADAGVDFAVLFELSVPAGSDEFSSDSWDPGVGFAWAYAGAVPLAGTARLSWTGDDFQVDNGLKLPISLGGPHSLFFEWEANLPENGNAAHWLNSGYQFLVADDSQLDVNGGLGLNDRAGDYRLGIGFSKRF